VGKLTRRILNFGETMRLLDSRVMIGRIRSCYCILSLATGEKFQKFFNQKDIDYAHDVVVGGIAAEKAMRDASKFEGLSSVAKKVMENREFAEARRPFTTGRKR
jgi:hypothetical protein